MPVILPEIAPLYPDPVSPPATPAGTVATTQYGYQTQPWDAPLSFGVQAFIEYNGYILNDRHQADRIRIFNITGLDDPDVSDSREVIPGDHGEFVYDSWYRGRSFIFTGAIESGSLGVLKRLERDLKAAFAPLSESPMKFRWFDIFDGFNDPLTLQNYTAVTGSAYLSSLTVANGILRVGTTQNVILMRTADNRLWGDKQVTMRVVIGSIDASAVSVIVCYMNDQNYVAATLRGFSLLIQIVVNGAVYVLSSVAVTGLVQGQSVWLRGRSEGDLITAELWTSPPQATTLPAYSTSAWLAGSDADNLGDQVLSQVGFGIQATTPNWALDDFRVSSLCPGDVSFNAKKLTALSIKDSQDSMTRFKRQFQITMRASQPRQPGALCATQSRSSTLVPTAGFTQTGFTWPLRFPLTFRSFLPNTVSLTNNILSINNRGTVFTCPQIIVFGAISNFTLINLTNNQSITWTGTLTDGDFLVFDCVTRTLVNSAGANMLEFFSSSTPQWMWLEPGWNDIYIAGAGYSGNTKLFAFFRSAWM